MMKITYFDFTGRAFAIRVCLRIAGIQFEDERIAYRELKEARGPSRSCDRFPLGSVPTMTLPCGKVMTQSKAILRYVARRANLYPDDMESALFVDEVIDCCDAALDAIPVDIDEPPADMDEATKLALRRKYADGYLKLTYNLLARRLQEQQGKFLLGDEFSVADICIYSLFKLMQCGFLDGIPTDYGNDNPILAMHANAVEAHLPFGRYNSQKD